MGQTMKLANNMLSATAMAASSEAMIMGVKAGLDPSVMIEVINAGSGMNTATRDKFPRAILLGTFDYGFSNGLMYKDLRLCMEEEDAMAVPSGQCGPPDVSATASSGRIRTSLPSFGASSAGRVSRCARRNQSRGETNGR